MNGSSVFLLSLCGLFVGQVVLLRYLDVRAIAARWRPIARESLVGGTPGSAAAGAGASRHGTGTETGRCCSECGAEYAPEQPYVYCQQCLSRLR